VKVEDRLPAAPADVDDHAVIVEPGLARRVGDEREHPPRLVRLEFGDVAKGLDVPLGDDQEVGVRLRIDVADRDEPVALSNVLARGVQLTEQAVVRQRGSPPA
jgi:hypothetical protein